MSFARGVRGVPLQKFHFFLFFFVVGENVLENKNCIDSKRTVRVKSAPFHSQCEKQRGKKALLSIRFARSLCYLCCSTRRHKIISCCWNGTESNGTVCVCVHRWMSGCTVCHTNLIDQTTQRGAYILSLFSIPMSRAITDNIALQHRVHSNKISRKQLISISQGRNNCNRSTALGKCVYAWPC